MDDVHGQLALGILPEVLRHVAFLRESGRVDVRSQAQGREGTGSDPHAFGDGGPDTPHGWIEVRDGRPVHAVCRRPDGGEAHGLEALATMLAWRQGSYLVRAHPFPEGDREVAESLPHRTHRPGANGAGDATGSHAPASPAEDPGASDPNGSYGRTLVGSAEAVLEAAQAWGARRNGVHGKAAELERSEPDGVVAEPTVMPPTAPRIRGASTLLRATGVAADAPIRATHGALELWLHLDGVTTLAELAAALGQDVDAVRSRADELLMAGIARVAPQPIYGEAFVADLVRALNEIMGPMGEILVEDALFEHHLDPRAIPRDRIDDLTTALARQLRRSDWQLKLRARVTRLLAEARPECGAEARVPRRSDAPPDAPSPGGGARGDGHAHATERPEARATMHRADRREVELPHASDSRTEDTR